ncbi:glycosyltransferase [Phenylobacterium sp. VNQ135]|uniref:glycosyltransferase n=1 Tax=Phenylobacterium sp. VNQ135 TaxID=3400922 RepID=UPI003C0F9947
MRIAIQDCWPNLPENAEKEFIARFRIACAKLGLDSRAVVTSDDIHAYDPDVVLISHEFGRKLTKYPTVGLIWSPLEFFRRDPYRVKSILSYDGYLAGSEGIREFLSDLQAGLPVEKPISESIFLPTTYTTDLQAFEQAREPSLTYIGVHWDGHRHRKLFERLVEQELITCYGPKASWEYIAGAYGGYVPFDGRSLIQTIAKHGLALCIHKMEHRKANTPSMRIFETCAVGGLPICDEIPFARAHLKDFAFFIDTDERYPNIVAQLKDIVEWARAHPKEVAERGRAAKEWFDRNWSLEAKIESALLPLLAEVKTSGKFTCGKPSAGAPRDLACDVVIRTGGRDISFPRRAIESVRAANSEEFPLRILLVDYKGRADVEQLAREAAGDGLEIEYVRSPGTGFRSTALWDGLGRATAPFVAHLDDDDTIYPNHYRQLFEAFNKRPDAKLCYSGVVRIEDEEGFYFDPPNFAGAGGRLIPERRDLHFLESYSLLRLMKFDNFIQSNTWMARTSYLQSKLGPDPKLLVAEDVYLYLLCAADGPLTFTGSPTAAWHWRSRTTDNSMTNVPQAVWQHHARRVQDRLRSIPFPMSRTFGELLDSDLSGFAISDTIVEPRKDGLDLERRAEGGFEIACYAELEGFHEPEKEGLWTRSKIATMALRISDRAAANGGVLRLCVGGTFDEEQVQRFTVSILGGSSASFHAVNWKTREIELPFPSAAAPFVVLEFTCESLRSFSQPARDLGVFVKTIEVQPATGSSLVDDEPEPQRLRSQNGLAAGPLALRTKGSMGVTANGQGVLLIGSANELNVYHLPENRGFSGSVSYRCNWLMFLQQRPWTDVELEVAARGEKYAEPAIKLNVEERVELGPFFTTEDTDYQHIDMTVVPSARHSPSRTPLFMRLQRHGAHLYLEVRESYGASWKPLHMIGRRQQDSHGSYVRANINDFRAAVFNPDAAADAPAAVQLAADILRAFLCRAALAIYTEAPGRKREFLTRCVHALAEPLHAGATPQPAAVSRMIES